jgi:hypothetical protein
MRSPKRRSGGALVAAGRGDVPARAEMAQLQRLTELRELVFETVVHAYADGALRSLDPGISDAEIAQVLVRHIDPGVYEAQPRILARRLADQCCRVGLLEHGADVNQTQFYRPTGPGIDKVRRSSWHLWQLLAPGVGGLLAVTFLLLLGT